MEPTPEELTIANRHHTVKGERIDHLGIMYLKPWGQECLVHQTNDTAIWILNIKANKSTSLHCHFKKDTVLVGLDGCTKVGLFGEDPLELHPLDSVLVPAKKFHSVGAFGGDVWVMEIEVFGEERFSNKNDLLRLDDAFGRAKTGYESSAQPTNGGLRLPFKCGDTTVSKVPGTVNFLLEGIVRSGEVYLGPGSKVTSGNLVSVTRHGYQDDHKILWGEEHLKLQQFSADIVMTSGCFDILHSGHIKILNEAASLGPLLVCLSSDAQIERLKGNGRPVNTLKDRLAVLKSLSCVTWVLVYDETNDELEETLDRLINIVRPAVWVKGSDYCEASILMKHPGISRVHLVSLVDGVSTTHCINKASEIIQRKNTSVIDVV